MEIRLAERTDLDAMLALDHGYETEKVWQLESLSEDGRPSANFRIARLPRPMKVEYPFDPQILASRWKLLSAAFVAEEGEALLGYITIAEPFQPENSWVVDGVVHPRQRRKGIGASLLLHAQRWVIKQQRREMTLALQSKNYPAIQLVQKLGFEFSGYNDRFFGNQDIALFFSKELR